MRSTEAATILRSKAWSFRPQDGSIRNSTGMRQFGHGVELYANSNAESSRSGGGEFFFLINYAVSR